MEAKEKRSFMKQKKLIKTEAIEHPVNTKECLSKGSNINEATDSAKPGKFEEFRNINLILKPTHEQGKTLEAVEKV
jgi:hypothetical protein